jgi:hypothetical protein
MKAAGASSAVIPARIAMSCWSSCQAIEIAAARSPSLRRRAG